MSSHDATAAPPSTPELPSIERRRRVRPGYVPLLLLGFVLATASFFGAALYADRRLEAVAQRSHQVSDNAMPSIVYLSAMRRELAHVNLLLDEASEGNLESANEVPLHVSAFREAQGRYEPLAHFPGEPELWARARVQLEALEATVNVIIAHVSAGGLPAADAKVKAELTPGVRQTDELLERLVDLNHENGVQAAAEADAARAQTRRISAVFVSLCCALTGGLALAAYLGFRRYRSETTRREQELEAFAGRVAHDIRSPLAPALFALEGIVHERVPEGEVRKRMAERGMRGLNRVLDLVGDLLAFAGSAAAPETEASASLRVVLGGVVQDLESAADAARVEMVLEEPPALEVACTRGVLTSIALNLVGNAIKHFPADKEPRRVVVRAEERGRRVHVEVTDTGAGLSPEEQRRVFEPYVRVDPSRPGLGLGLTTVRRLVQSYGGVVGVRSQRGEGSVFWFELPVRR
jgi:signal transduction histidine kinase